MSHIYDKISSHPYFPLSLAATEVVLLNTCAGHIWSRISPISLPDSSKKVMRQFKESFMCESLEQGVKNIAAALFVLAGNRIFRVCVPFSKLAAATVVVTLGGVLIALINQYRNWIAEIQNLDENLIQLKDSYKKYDLLILEKIELIQSRDEYEYKTNELITKFKESLQDVGQNPLSIGEDISQSLQTFIESHEGQIERESSLQRLHDQALLIQERLTDINEFKNNPVNLINKYQKNCHTLSSTVQGSLLNAGRYFKIIGIPLPNKDEQNSLAHSNDQIRNIVDNFTYLLKLADDSYKHKQFFHERLLIETSKLLIEPSLSLLKSLPEKTKMFQLSLKEYYAQHLQPFTVNFTNSLQLIGYQFRESEKTIIQRINGFITYAKKEVKNGNGDWKQLLSDAEFLSDCYRDLANIKKDRKAYLEKTIALYEKARNERIEIATQIQALYKFPEGSREELEKHLKEKSPNLNEEYIRILLDFIEVCGECKQHQEEIDFFKKQLELEFPVTQEEQTSRLEEVVSTGTVVQLEELDEVSKSLLVLKSQFEQSLLDVKEADEDEISQTLEKNKNLLGEQINGGKTTLNDQFSFQIQRLIESEKELPLSPWLKTLGNINEQKYTLIKECVIPLKEMHKRLPKPVPAPINPQPMSSPVGNFFQQQITGQIKDVFRVEKEEARQGQVLLEKILSELKKSREIKKSKAREDTSSTSSLRSEIQSFCQNKEAELCSLYNYEQLCKTHENTLSLSEEDWQAFKKQKEGVKSWINLMLLLECIREIRALQNLFPDVD